MDRIHNRFREFSPCTEAGCAAVVLFLTAGPVLAQATIIRPPAAPPDDLTPEERIAVNVYATVNRSVVHITTRSVAADEVFGLFAEARAGTGSGSVLDKNGHIVTNFHVVENARRIEVTLADGSAHEAKLVGADPNNDLAVIQDQRPGREALPDRLGRLEPACWSACGSTPSATRSGWSGR